MLYLIFFTPIISRAGESMLSWLVNYQLYIEKNRNYYLRYVNSWNFAKNNGFPWTIPFGIAAQMLLYSLGEKLHSMLLLCKYYGVAKAEWGMICLSSALKTDVLCTIASEYHALFVDFISTFLQLIPYCARFCRQFLIFAGSWLNCRTHISCKVWIPLRL